MRTVWLKVWSAFAIALIWLGVPLQAQFVYVANSGDNTVSGYTMNPVSGALTAIAGSPFKGGSYPNAVAVNGSGRFAYVAHDENETVTVSLTLATA
jgi:DNA-binding beta-propeller fold protein YncE